LIPLPPSLPKLLEDDFQFTLCEGCRQESPNLKLLTCLHTLCPGCLSKNKPLGQCPVCQTAIPQASDMPDTDNLLFASLQARLKVYKKIVDGVDLFCDNCKKASEFWCSECEEFLCTKCFQTHQRYLKRESHEAKRVMDIRAGSAKDFIKGTRRTGHFSCSNPTHKSQTVRVDRGRGVCGGLLARVRRVRLMELSKKVARCFSCRDGQQRRVCFADGARPAWRGLGEQHGCNAGQGLNALRGKPKREGKGLEHPWRPALMLATMAQMPQRQEVMDMQPFIKDSLEQLQQLQPPATRDQAQPGDLAECRARLQALVERVTGHPEATPAPATENSHQVRLGFACVSTSAKRKKVQNANVMTSPVKVIKVAGNDDGWKRMVPEQPSWLDQPGTSCSVSPMTLAREDNLLEDVPDGNDRLHDSDSDILCLDSCEEESTDEELMDPSLLDNLSNILDKSFPISSQDTLDTRQGSLVFFDVKISKNETIQMTVVDGEKIFPVLIHPVKYLPTLMANNRVYEIGLRNLLCHLNTVHRPILCGFGLWSLPFPTLLKALMVMNKKEEFSSVVYGFLDILPLVREEVPERDNYKLKNLASTYLWWHFGDSSAMENANIVKYLCDVLDVNPVKKPRLILSQTSLDSFISLQPLVDEKLLTKPSAQTLATQNIGLATLWLLYQQNGEKGLQELCYLINTHRQRSQKRVQNLSKVKVFFQRQEQLAASHETSAGSHFPGAIKSKEKC
ncbi:Protein PML, partial [Aptenodytes patagonicus]